MAALVFSQNLKLAKLPSATVQNVTNVITVSVTVNEVFQVQKRADKAKKLNLY